MSRGRSAATLTWAADDVDPKLLKQYQSLVGALLYCSTQTRPDVAFSVAMLCRAMSRPTPELYSDAQRVLRYSCVTSIERATSDSATSASRVPHSPV